MRLEADIREQYDVLVAGGGVAGVFAAICAARLGAKTLLVEKDSMLGGTATLGGVDFPGIFHAWGRQIISGPCWESIERAEKLGGAVIPPLVYRPEHHWDMQVRVDGFVYEWVLEDMCRQAGVDVRLHTMLAHARETGEGIEAALCGREGLYGVWARTAVDATGDGEMAAMLGCRMEKTDPLQPGTLMNRIGGYDLHTVRREDVERAFGGLDLQGASPWHMLKTGRVNMHMPVTEAHTSRGRSQMEMDARHMLMDIVRRMRGIEGLEHVKVTWAAPSFGVREGRRIVGRHRITEEEYYRGEKYPDSVCHSFYPIDLHVPGSIDIRPLPEGVTPCIPYRALLPKDGAGRILAAGRCISGDPLAASAFRVQASCMATGQAAGTAAALCAGQGIILDDLSITELRHALSSLRCVVPEE